VLAWIILIDGGRETSPGTEGCSLRCAGRIRGAPGGGRGKLTRGGKRHSRYWPRPSAARDRVLVNPLYLFIPRPGIAGPSSHRRKPPCPRLTSDIDRSASRRNARERADNSSPCIAGRPPPRINARGSARRGFSRGGGGGGGEGDGANRERIAVIGLDFVAGPMARSLFSVSLFPRTLSLSLPLALSRVMRFLLSSCFEACASDSLP